MEQSTEQTALEVYNPQSTLQEMTRTGEIDKYLYSFKQGGKEVSDLNVDGINRLAVACGVSIDDVTIIDEDESHITVKAVAVNPDGLKHHGIARECKFNTKGYPNPYALANATSKAQRNAKKGLIPIAEVRDAIKNAGREVPTEDTPEEQQRTPSEKIDLV